MEVAPPLTFSHTKAGPKRSLACSPGLMETTNLGLYEGSDDHDQYSQRFFKRRRFNSDERIESLSEKFASASPFATAASLGRSPQQSQHGFSLKRNRSVPSPVQLPVVDLSHVVEKQAAEIESLKKDKSELESSYEKLRSENDKVLHENKILKRAVTIQQERQVHATTEMEAARQYKVDAEDKMKRMEQMIMYLRYHLQSQQPSTGNDFMDLAPRNPDVY